MARTIPMPSKEKLPDGPRRVFVTELRRYYRVARPSLREISQAIERHPDPRLDKVTASAETVRRMITGKVLPERERLYAVFRVLCDMAEVDPDAEHWEDDGSYTATPTPRATGSTSGSCGMPRWKTSPTPRPFLGRPRLRLNLSQPGRLRTTTRGTTAAATPTSRPFKRGADKESGRNRGNRRALTRTRLAAVSASVFHRRGFGVGEGDDPAHGGADLVRAAAGVSG